MTGFCCPRKGAVFLFTCRHYLIPESKTKNRNNKKYKQTVVYSCQSIDELATVAQFLHVEILTSIDLTKFSRRWELARIFAFI